MATVITKRILALSTFPVIVKIHVIDYVILRGHRIFSSNIDSLSSVLDKIFQGFKLPSVDASVDHVLVPEKLYEWRKSYLREKVVDHILLAVISCPIEQMRKTNLLLVKIFSMDYFDVPWIWLRLICSIKRSFDMMKLFAKELKYYHSGFVWLMLSRNIDRC